MMDDRSVIHKNSNNNNGRFDTLTININLHCSSLVLPKVFPRIRHDDRRSTQRSDEWTNWFRFRYWYESRAKRYVASLL